MNCRDVNSKKNTAVFENSVSQGSTVLALHLIDNENFLGIIDTSTVSLMKTKGIDNQYQFLPLSCSFDTATESCSFDVAH